MDLSIINLFTKEVLSVNEDETLFEADKTMSSHGIRHLPVINREGKLVGLVSITDFKALKKIKADLKFFNIKDFMSSPVIAVPRSASIKEVAQLLIQKKINCVMIVENQTPVGIITSEDFIRVLVQNVDVMAQADKITLESLAPDGLLLSS